MENFDLHIKASAPTRADFAGGTLDVKPVAEILRALAEERGEQLPVRTLNIALELRAHCEIQAWRRHQTPEGSWQLQIQSSLQGTNDTFDMGKQSGREALRKQHPLLARCTLPYQSRLAKNFQKLSIRLSSSVPRGSGLGGSSSLVVTLLAALERTLDTNYQPQLDWLCEAACDVEAGLLGSLAGIQDHLGAAYGGLHSFMRLPGKIESTSFPEEALVWAENHCLLAITPGEHHSGTTNWTLLKALMEKDSRAQEAFTKLAHNANQTYEALCKNDYTGFCVGLSSDWSIRKNAFPGLSTDAINRLEDAAKKAGADGFKVCGAAAGGVALLACHDPSKFASLRNAIAASGAEVLPLKAAREGLRVETVIPRT